MQTTEFLGQIRIVIPSYDCIYNIYVQIHLTKKYFECTYENRFEGQPVGKVDFGTRLLCIEKEIIGARNTYIQQGTYISNEK